MRFKRPIYRILFYAAWVAVIGGIVTLLVAANSKSRTRTCKGVAVSVNNNGDRIFVEKEDVLKTIEKTAHGSIVGRHSGDINLASLERNLETNPWIRDAELYFDTKDVLHVSVSERLPVARVFNTAGISFYIDSTGKQMPLLDNYSAKLPVVTGYPAAKRFNSADSLVLTETKQVLHTISTDAFWNAQIGQIDITPERKFELIPVLGSHVIRLGDGNNVAEKLAKLMVFYKQVLPKAGFAKYSALDLQYDGQVVAVRKGQTSTVDSLQLQKNIEELMKRKMAEQEPDDALQPATETVQKSGDVEAPLAATPTDTAADKPVIAVARDIAVPTVKRAVPAKTKAAGKTTVVKKTNPVARAVQQPAIIKKPAAAKPKAVMKKRAANEY